MKKIIFLILISVSLLIYGQYGSDFNALYTHNWYRVYFCMYNITDCILIRLNGENRWTCKRAWRSTISAFLTMLRENKVKLVHFTYDDDPIFGANRLSFLCDNFPEILSSLPQISGINFAYK